MTLGMQKYGRKEGETTKNKRKQQKNYLFLIKNTYFKWGREEGAEGTEVPECSYQDLHAP